MTSLGQAAAPSPSRPTAKRPSNIRKLGALSLDLAFSSFLGWTATHAFGSPDLWNVATAAVFLSQYLLCRGALRPTLGDYFMGIRYLASSSHQVVADIRVVDPKLKLNGFLLFSGWLETLLGVGFLSLWTLFDRSVFVGTILNAPSSFSVYALYGFILFFCATTLLGASRTALWAVPSTHGFLMLVLLRDAPLWLKTLPGTQVLWPWAEKPVVFAPGDLGLFLSSFVAWSILVVLGTLLSRKYLVH